MSTSIDPAPARDEREPHPSASAPQSVPPEDTGDRAAMARIRRQDRAFAGLAGATGWFIVALIGAIAVFLLAWAAPSVAKDSANFLTSSQWNVTDAGLSFGIAGLLWTTALSSVVAMLVAVPVAVGVALLITQYAPKQLSGTIGFLVDLLAAVPSVVYGLWGALVLAPRLHPVSNFLQDHMGWFPLFGRGLASSGTVFVASVVLAIMILPIITAITRDVFAQTPRDQIEAAWALGATRWEMIRTAVLPHGRSGLVAAAMLGLGRALGETIAVMLILSTTHDPKINFSLFAGGETFASKIANNAAEFDSQQKAGAYIAAGLVLFAVTFAVNALARMVANRGRARA